MNPLVKKLASKTIKIVGPIIIKTVVEIIKRKK